MALSWAEIKERAIQFSKKWEDAENEASEAKPFLIDFFNIFGVSNRRVTAFETHVKKLDQRDGFIDMLWKGKILVEMKSRGKNLDRAYTQAKDYFPGLKEYELPQFVLVCDFQTFHLYDLEYDKKYIFTLDKLYTKVNLFGFIAGYGSTVEIKEQDPVNIKAAESMGRLHDSLKMIGYEGHDLELYLVRLLFCMFADDTTIFNTNIFYDYIINHSSEDGSNLASVINEIFEVLNTPHDKRLKNISEELNAFPYVNGGLFKERLPLASYDTKMRNVVLECCLLDWGKISPAIFGSMFQSVMNPTERRNLGAHYTSETNILKLIKPLFLDDLQAEFERVKGNKKQLEVLHQKIASLKFLDPACGCGNFLVVTYREIRLLEIEILKATYGQNRAFNIGFIVLCDVDNYYGLEYEEFPAQIAQVALWLMDHQMNMKCSEEFGEYFARLPLKKSAQILHADALEQDWNDVIPSSELSYIIGNPPFIGSKLMSETQRAQVVREFDGVAGSGTLDYVSAWYAKAAKYIANTSIKVAFVSTNSIVQGEQVAILWGKLLNEYGVKINFAHRTFKWSNEARGKAAVYCVIIGFASFDTPHKFIFDYEDIRGEAHKLPAKNINAYLVDAPNILIGKRSKPLCDVPAMSFGNMPLDGGNLLFTDEEKIEFIAVEPKSEMFFKPLISAREFLNGQKRWCLWLVDAKPAELRSMPSVMKRIEAVKEMRLNSVDKGAQKLADTPTLFRDINNPDSFIVIPAHSSENRKYIPMGFFNKDSIANNSCQTIPNGGLYHFGMLMSSMNMAWVKYVCGRLKSDYRYSKDIVYNNFPWAENPTEKQISKIEECAQAVLDARQVFEDSSLADLYDPITMPPALVKAHNALDRAVDAAYRSTPFTTATSRIEFLFDLY
ncbi:MAG: DNA methyltransferase, partial [Rikenellaceae bacterium]